MNVPSGSGRGVEILSGSIRAKDVINFDPCNIVSTIGHIVDEGWGEVIFHPCYGEFIGTESDGGIGVIGTSTCLSGEIDRIVA